MSLLAHGVFMCPEDYPAGATIHSCSGSRVAIEACGDESQRRLMILSGKEIERHLGDKIVIDPYRPSQLNPNSYNLRLHEELRVYDASVLDMRRENTSHQVVIPKDGLQLQPNRLYLGRTEEYTATDGFVPMLEGRSSIGRLGLFVHITAGFGDVGFRGYWTLEMFCVQPIVIYPNVEICQVFYHTIEGDYVPYKSGKYQNNTGIQHSLLFREFDASQE